MKQPEKPFRCVECGNTGDMIWKTRNAKPTFVTTIFGSVSLPQIQKLRMFPWFLLDTDGDMSILKGIKGLNIIFQRCLW